MKKLLLVSFVFALGIFLYQNTEFDLLNNSQKKLLLKEMNIANQLELHNEMPNESDAKETIQIEKETSNNETSSNKKSDDVIDKYYRLVKNYISTYKTEPQLEPISQKEDQIEQQKEAQIDSVHTANLDVLAMIEKVSFEDQIKVANILLNRFSFSELYNYRTMVSHGINEEEKKQIKEEVLSRLTEEDLIRLKKIAEAYVVEYYPEQQERFNTVAKRYIEGQ